MLAIRFSERIAEWNPPGEPEAAHEFCASVLEHYLAAERADRAAFRAAVRRNPALWKPVGDDALSAYLDHAAAHSTPVDSLRAQLLVCALTGGIPDWRDTIAWLTRVWASAVRRGVDPRPHFEEIGATADDENLHGISGLSTRGLFRNAVRLAESGRGDERRPEVRKTAPCPRCGKPLRTARARQCFECGADWHEKPADADATRDRTNTRVQPPVELPVEKAPATEPSSVPKFTPGDRYRFGDELARGGMGVVHRATDTAFGREVAIKIVGPGRAGSESVQRFVAEARITGQLQHPGIPPVHDLGTLPDGRPFLAMKLIKGRTLAEDIRAKWKGGGRLETEEVERRTRIFEQICLAVAFAHSRRVIHRDLKPLNVMVGAFGEVQVMDWGLAKELDAAIPLAEMVPEPEGATEVLNLDPDERTMAGRVMGTPSYMPPEQARGEIERIDERADVFALGGILLTLLTGRPPYSGRTGGEVWNKAVAGDLGEALGRLDGVTGAGRLPALAKKCLNLDPSQRPAHAGEVAAAVHTAREWAERVKRGEELTQATDDADHASRRSARRSRLALVLGIIGFAIGLTVAAFALLNAFSSDAERTERVAQSASQRKAASKEQFEELVDAIAHGLESNRFARGWDGDYRQRIANRLEQMLRDLEVTEQIRAQIVFAAIQDAAQERDSADRHWYDARGHQAELTPSHPEWELAVAAVGWAGGRKPFGDLERRIYARAAAVLKRKEPPELSEELKKRVELARQALETSGVKLK